MHGQNHIKRENLLDLSEEVDPETNFEKYKVGLRVFYVYVTVHRNKFLYNKIK